jgi:5-formyltetrahydrofolate cyclo-ligase
MDKASLRAEMIARRDAADPADIAASSRRVCARVAGSEAFRASRSVFVYLSFGNEVDTSPIIAAALDAGKRVCVPSRVDARTMRAVWFSGDPADLCESWPGIRSVREDRCGEAQPEEIDLCLAPGVAFDRRRERLGFGAGYYDRFLQKLGTGCHKIGLAHSFQIVERIPGIGPQDVRMDRVVTELETF